MKKIWIIVVILVILLVVGYLGRRKIKTLFGGNTPLPAAPTQGMTNTNTVPSANIFLIKNDSVKGSYLTDFQGTTLYTFDKDTTGVSNCSGDCVKMWLPYSSGATAQSTFPQNISVITRSDGAKQFAWKGLPLYYYSKDLKSGDINGDGVGNFWHIVKP